MAITTITSTSTVRTNMCLTCPTRGSTTTWVSLSVPGNGIILVMNQCGFRVSSIQKEFSIGSTIGDGAATTGITGKTCCRTICQSCECVLKQTQGAEGRARLVPLSRL